MNKITGVIPAMVTCFNEREELDEKRLRRVIRFLKEEKADGLYLTGSTGEGFVMTPEERKQVVEITADELNGEIPFIVHVGAIGTKVTCDLARHAEKCGAAAVSSVPPFYWKFSEDSIVRYYTELADSVSVPTIIYNIALAGVMNFDTIRRLASVPGVKGIKYTAPTQFDILRMRQELDPEFIIYSGSDEMAMSGLSYGADGIIGTFYNVLLDLYKDLYQAFLDKDMDRLHEKQSIANRVIMTTLQHDMIPTVKLMMKWMGIDAGIARSPFTCYSQEVEQKIRQEFAGIKAMPGADKVKFLQEV